MDAAEDQVDALLDEGWRPEDVALVAYDDFEWSDLFSPGLTAAAQDFAPHDVTFYLRELAASYHSYYDAERILVDDETVKKARLALVAATALLVDRFALLGLPAQPLSAAEFAAMLDRARAALADEPTEVRRAADALERVVNNKYWPMPTYRQMLFVK